MGDKSVYESRTNSELEIRSRTWKPINTISSILLPVSEQSTTHTLTCLLTHIKWNEGEEESNKSLNFKVLWLYLKTEFLYFSVVSSH